jgi:hypothetical protein
MKVTELKWRTDNDGELWTLIGDCKGSDAIIVNRKLFEVAYLGRGRGRGPMRWKVTDRRYWIDNPEDIPEFDHVHEAKAWVDTVVRLET